MQESSELWPKLQFTEQQLAATRTQLGNAQEERDECVASETAMRNKLAEEKRIHESTTKKLELTREKVENLTLDLEQTREGWDDFKKETRLLQRQVEKEWESKELQAQALFMSRCRLGQTLAQNVFGLWADRFNLQCLWFITGWLRWKRIAQHGCSGTWTNQSTCMRRLISAAATCAESRCPSKTP